MSKIYIGSWKNTTSGKTVNTVISSKLPCKIRDLIIGCTIALAGGLFIANRSFEYGAVKAGEAISDTLMSFAKKDVVDEQDKEKQSEDSYD